MPRQCQRKLRHYAPQAGEKNNPLMQQTMAGVAVLQNNAMIHAHIFRCICTETAQKNPSIIARAGLQPK